MHGSAATSSHRYASLRELAVKKVFVRFVRDDSGSTSIELGLITAGISLAIIVIMISLVTIH